MKVSVSTAAFFILIVSITFLFLIGDFKEDMKIYKGKPKLFQWSILRLALLQKKKLGELGLANQFSFQRCTLL